VVDLLIPTDTTEAHQAHATTYLAQHNLPEPDYPFTRDGCTLFPDQLPGHDFYQACLDHDIAYWAGGSEALRHEVNLAFHEAITHTGHLGPVLAPIMYYAVTYLGNNGVSRTVGSHWGYGWK
jgi:hypothetical protein